MPTNAYRLFFSISRSIGHLYTEREAASIAHLLLEEIFGLTRTDVLLQKPLEAGAEDRLKPMMARLVTGEPVQYVLGSTWFMSRKFHVGKEVLIPRPETEELVLMVLNALKNHEKPVIADLGTGSGCIAVSLAAEKPESEVWAFDISEKALTTARTNALLAGVNIYAARYDLLRPTEMELPRFSAVVSNPPYVAEHEKPGIHQNVLGFEPESAIFVPDNDPLLFYRSIVRFAVRYLCPEGRIFVELNPHYAQETAALFSREGFKEVTLYKDIHGKNRFLEAISP